MALSIVKNTPDPSADRPHVQAFRDNDAAIRATRAQLDILNEKDRKAAADQALAEATSAQIKTLQSEVDGLRADAVYANQPPPDTRAQEKKLQHLQQLLKTQTDHARAAAVVRSKYDADRQRLNAEISRRALLNPKLLFDALREDVLAKLAPEFLAAEQAMLATHRKVFAAALAVDIIAMENHFGQFVQSGNIRDLNISRPSHEAFDPHPLPPEQAQAARNQYANDVARDASSLVLELLKE